MQRRKSFNQVVDLAPCVHLGEGQNEVVIHRRINLAEIESSHDVSGQEEAIDLSRGHRGLYGHFIEERRIVREAESGQVCDVARRIMSLLKADICQLLKARRLLRD